MAVWQEVDSFNTERGTLRTWITMRAKYIALDKRRQLCRRQMYNLQSADENRQWSSSDNGGGRKTFGRGVYDNDSHITLPPHPEASMESLLEQSERREELRLALAMLPSLTAT